MPIFMQSKHRFPIEYVIYEKYVFLFHSIAFHHKSTRIYIWLMKFLNLATRARQTLRPSRYS